MHPINLHGHNDIYYLVLAAILQHNMLVEARLMTGEEESAAMYNTVETTAAESGNVGAEDDMMEIDNGETQEQGTHNMLRFEIAHKRWTAAKLKSAMMRHLYKQKSEQDAMSHAYDVSEAYDQLSY
jgi:hypothetical protein